VLDDAGRRVSTAVDREASDSVWTAPRAAEVHRRSSRDSPDVQKVERGAALSDMGPPDVVADDLSRPFRTTPLIECAIRVLRGTEVAQARMWFGGEALEECRASLDLPMPASPERSTAWPSPLLALDQRRSSGSVSLPAPQGGRAGRTQRLEAALQGNWSAARLRPARARRSCALPNSTSAQVVDLSDLIRRQFRSMITLLLHLFRLLPVLCGSHRHLALENSPCASSSLSTRRRSGGRSCIRATDSFGFPYPRCGQDGGRPSSS
jgi:hypothetical protein